MPQMAPLNWLSLMTIFIMIMTTFNMINYFSFNYNLMKKEKTNKTTPKTNWKW